MMDRHDPTMTVGACARSATDAAAASTPSSEDAGNNAEHSVSLLQPLIAVLARQIASQYVTTEHGSATHAHAHILFALTLAAGMLTYLLWS